MRSLRHLTILIGKRLLWLAVTLWVVFTITFFLSWAVPGGPFSSEKKVPPAIQRNLEAKFKMNEALWMQYTSQLWDAMRGDLRGSMRMQDYTVNEIIAQGFPVSASLGIFALSFALMFGMTAGVISAVRRNSLYDYTFMAAATLGIAVPNFVLAGVAILVVAFYFRLLPPAGWGSREHIWLPALCLAAPYTAYVARLTRAGMLEVLNLDYVRTAYAKGLTPRNVIVKHALRGAILPVVSYIGPAAAGILTGSLILERIFNIPGMGSHFIEAASQRDFTLMMGVVLVSTVLVYVMNMLVDISYAVIDPRVKVE
jgi:oligopeptide transport system permease protein